MKSFDFEAVVFDGDVFCTGCLHAVGVDAEDEDVQPIFADSEWDYYPVCNQCGYEHDYVSLTNEGREHHGSD
jgi:hypothetical protein